MWYNEMFQVLESYADQEKAVKMSAYMKDNFSFLGVPKPIVDKLTKPYIKTAAKEDMINWDFVELCWEKEYREAQYVGVEYIYAVQKKLTIDDLPRIKKLILTKAWWDIADGLDKVIGILSVKYPEAHQYMLQWSKSDELWLRRVAIDYQQKSKDKTNVIVLEQILTNNLKSDEFFINKAIGWSLRDYSKTDPDWVIQFVEAHKDKMSKLSIKEALKNMKTIEGIR